jgi:hypothetical protein
MDCGEGGFRETQGGASLPVFLSIRGLRQPRWWIRTFKKKKKNERQPPNAGAVRGQRALMSCPDRGGVARDREGTGIAGLGWAGNAIG